MAETTLPDVEGCALSVSRDAKCPRDGGLSGSQLSERDGGVVYRCAPEVAWVRDAGRVLLVDPERGRTWSLGGVEAAIWDWLVLGYGYEEIARYLSLILRTSKEEAGRALLGVLLCWQDGGIVQVSEES
jgi:hypothetical protein